MLRLPLVTMFATAAVLSLVAPAGATTTVNSSRSNQSEVTAPTAGPPPAEEARRELMEEDPPLELNSNNRAFLINPRDSRGQTSCTAGGGVVARDARGRNYCVGGTATPPIGAAVTTVNAAKSNSDLRVDFNQVCTAQGGFVVTTASSEAHCLVPTTTAPTPPPAR